jgi:hypothetical protein
LELQEEEEQAEEEATAEEKEEQAEITERVTIKLFPTLSSRLVTKLWVRGRERSGGEREGGSHWVSRWKVARFHVQTPSNKGLG